MKPIKWQLRWLIGLALIGLTAGCWPARVENTAAPAQAKTIMPDITRTFTSGPTLAPSRTPTPTLLRSPTFTSSSTITPTSTPVPFLGLVPEGARVRLGKGGIHSIALSHDGKTVAVGSQIAICLYGLPDASEEWCSMTGMTPDSTLNTLAFSPSGGTLAAGLTNGEIVLWDAVNGARQLEIQTQYLKTSRRAQYLISASLNWSPEGGRLAGLLDDGLTLTLAVWNSYDGSLLNAFDVSDFSPNLISWSPDGSRIAGGNGYSLQVIVWDARSGAEVFTQKYVYPGWYYISSLGWSLDSANLFVGTGYVSCFEYCSATYDGKIDIVEIQSGKLIREIGVGREVNSLSLSPDGNLLMAGGTQIGVYRVTDGSLVRRFSNSGIVGTFWLPDGKNLLTIDGSRNLLILNSTNDQRTKIPLEGFINITAMAWSPDSTLLATLTSSGTIDFWDRVSGKILREFKDTYSGSRIAWSPDGKAIAVSHGQQVILLDVQTGKQLKTLEGSLDFITDLAWSRDGRFFASLSSLAYLSSDESAYGVMMIWETQRWTVDRLIKVERSNVSLAWSPDGKMLASAGNGIYLWDVSTGELIQYFGNDYSELSTGFISWTPDEMKLVVGGDVWAISSQILLFNIPGTISSALSPDGKILALGGDEIILHDPANGNVVHNLKGYADRANRLFFSPDGKTLASGSDDGTALLWDIP